MEKRESAKSQGEFKVPRKPAVSVSASMDEDDRSGVSGIDDGGDNSRPDHSSRRYRDKSSRSDTPQGIFFLSCVRFSSTWHSCSMEKKELLLHFVLNYSLPPSLVLSYAL